MNLSSVVASSRSTRLPSDSGAFADWVANPSSSSALRSSDQDLSLGFNAGPSAAGGGWSSSATARQISYGVPAEMGMFVHISDPSHVHSLNNPPISNTGTTAIGVGVGVIPLITATNVTTNNNNNIQLWQPHPQTQTQHDYLRKPFISDIHGFSGGGGGSWGGSGSTSGSTMSCQDCGNQAKKDCNHRRCRTCCKSRGFDCATHVKSTWVPAARRRERQLMTSTGAAGAAGSSASTSVTKKPRLTSSTSHTSTSNTTPPRSFETSSCHQDASFMQSLPGQVRAPAVFKCVRVTAVEDGDDEYAYQACVTIGGHVFKGFLYDQGAQTRSHSNIPNLSELHLGGGGGGGGRNVGDSLTSTPLDTPAVYGGSDGGGMLG